jgi:hypothetical protein
MVGSPLNSALSILVAACKRTKNLVILFQPLPMFAAVDMVTRFVAENAITFAVLLSSAQILCILCGSYFYNLPKGFQI